MPLLAKSLNKLEDSMKVWRVVMDSDGETEREPGTVETKIERGERFFAADSVGEVFNAAISWAAAVNGEIIAVVEHCPSITILSR